VGQQEHFGIFDDGWFFLDPSGRWTEVGMVDIDGVQTSKWKEDFYNNLDYDKKHRIVVSYDREFIRIAYPRNDSTDNTEVWIFDPRGNRVFRDIYPEAVTVWGIIDATIQTAIDWDDTDERIFGKTWAEMDPTWTSYGAKFGLKNLNHGTTTGYIMVHNPNIITKYNGTSGAAVNPFFSLVGMLSSFGDPTTLKSPRKLWVEEIHSNTEAVTLGVQGDDPGQIEVGSVDFSADGIAGSIQTPFRTFNQIMSANLRYFVTGHAPVRIRSILVDVRTTPAEERLG
jgi:hypothetical protein